MNGSGTDRREPPPESSSGLLVLSGPFFLPLSLGWARVSNDRFSILHDQRGDRNEIDLVFELRPGVGLDGKIRELSAVVNYQKGTILTLKWPRISVGLQTIQTLRSMPGGYQSGFSSPLEMPFHLDVSGLLNLHLTKQVFPDSQTYSQKG